jgi:hypothetical protein
MLNHVLTWKTVVVTFRTCACGALRVSRTGASILDHVHLSKVKGHGLTVATGFIKRLGVAKLVTKKVVSL